MGSCERRVPPGTSGVMVADALPVDSGSGSSGWLGSGLDS